VKFGFDFHGSYHECILSSYHNIQPIKIIQFAQITNGMVLPVISGFLLCIMNQKKILGKYSNNLYQNIFGFIILGATII
jgi:Mn2+/Fe2+ NRAMP family transporter